MNNIWTIAKREYKLYFASPVAYLMTFFILLVVGADLLLLWIRTLCTPIWLCTWGRYRFGTAGHHADLCDAGNHHTFAG